MGNTAKNFAFSEVFSSWRGERDSADTPKGVPSAERRRFAPTSGCALVRHGCGMFPQAGIPCSWRAREPTAEKALPHSKTFRRLWFKPSQQQRPRDGKNAISGSWRGERDLRLWRRAPVNSPPGCSVCAHPICFLTIRAQTARSHSRLHPQIPLKNGTTEKGADESQLPFPWRGERDLNPRTL